MAKNPVETSAGSLIGGAVAGAIGAHVLNQAVPIAYDLDIGGKRFQVRPAGAIALAAGLAAAFGVEIPGEAYVLPVIAGALAYEASTEVGPDVASLLLGPAQVPAPAPVGLPPAPSPAAFAAYGYPYQGYVTDPQYQAAMQGLRNF